MSAVSYYHSPELPWSRALAEEKRFRAITAAALILFVALCLLIAWLEVPKPDRAAVEQLPPRLAKLVIKEQPAPPPPPPEPVPAEPEQKPEAPKAEAPKETAPAVAAAREKAARSGLLALQSELAALQRNDLSALLGNRPLVKGQAQDGARRSTITSTATTGSGGIDTSQLSRDTGETQLAARDTTVVESALLAEEQQAAKQRKPTGRSIEEIKRVLDQNKGALDALYQRALRSNPTLQGKVVLEITIAPSGAVVSCKAVSSELDDAELLRKLVARVQLFQFGAKQVEPTVFTWPLDFLPSS